MCCYIEMSTVHDSWGNLIPANSFIFLLFYGSVSIKLNNHLIF